MADQRGGPQASAHVGEELAGELPGGKTTGLCEASVVDERVLAQHRQIRALAHDIEQTVDLLPLVSKLQEMRDLLGDHFFAEEGPGGFYETVRAASPRLGNWVDRLQEDHQALLATIDQLSRQTVRLVALVDTVTAESRALTGRLARHEAEEEAVLHECVSTDLGRGA